jgi:hypothetical protein
MLCPDGTDADDDAGSATKVAVFVCDCDAPDPPEPVSDPAVLPVSDSFACVVPVVVSFVSAASPLLLLSAPEAVFVVGAKSGVPKPEIVDILLPCLKSLKTPLHPTIIICSHK